MTLSSETVMAFIDGELSTAEENDVARLMENDAALRTYVEQQRMLRTQLRAEFAGVLKEPIPERFERAVLGAPVGVARQASKGRGAKTIGRLGYMFGPKGVGWISVAAAAGLVAGVLLMSFGGTPIGSEILIARGALADSLSTQLASEQSSGNETWVGVTFLNQDGSICRTFVGGGALAGAAGIACYDGGYWRLRALAPIDESSSGTYQRAGASMPTILRESVESMIAGLPFDAERERAARDTGWIAR